jgi:malonyl CoA-acyl carrier protein transacylase
MGKDLFDRFRDLTRTASDILGYSLEELCLEDPRNELRNTGFTQPAVYVVNALAWRRWQAETDAAPAFLMGHSLGEYNALEAAGAIGFEDGLRLVQKRGALMAEAPPGAMAAVIGMTEERIRETLATNDLDTIDVANLNAPNQIILSGLKEDIERAAPIFESDSVRYLPLNTGGAFHSRYMKDARKAFEAVLAEFYFGRLAIPVISNVYAVPYAADADVAATLGAQITEPVQWAKSLRYALAQGEDSFEELGHGQVLTGLAAEIRKAAPAVEIRKAAPAVEAAAPTPVRTPAQTPAPAAVPAAYDRDRELAVLQQQIDDWNRDHPPGTEVLVAGYDGSQVTRTKAMTLFGHRAAIYLEGYNGYRP